MDLHVSFHGMDTSPAADTLIRQLAAELERVSDRISTCEVVVEAVSRRHRQGDQYAVRIDLTVAGGRVVISRDNGSDHRHEALPVAIHDAFHTARRRLQDHMRQLDGDTKRHEDPAMAAVVRLFPDRGYGFIEIQPEGEVYFHRNSVKGAGFDSLKVGDCVRYVLDEEPGEQGTHASAVFPT